MNGDEEDIFWQEMSGVEPLRRERRVPVRRKGLPDNDSSMAHRRSAAVADLEPDGNNLTDTGIDPLDPWYVLDFKRPGIQNGVYRKLRQGRYEVEAGLDMHRMSVEVARHELFAFVQEAQLLGLRTLILIHGKGESAPGREQASILKGCTNHWLRQLEVVQAFHSAQPRHGGTGAVYILLRKSAEKKRQNRERYGQGE
ncbi:MAG: DNA endonuclease SmrA [Halieaceae bacterium]|nr:DNA endonuclease SmrA [Halieaceae bacterium]